MSLDCHNPLLYTPNWLGDAIMCLPALQTWRAAHPRAHLTVLTKPGLAPLWQLCPDVDTIVTVQPGTRGTLRTARALRAGRHDAALALPNSFRSALIPWLAAIPRRRGAARHGRAWLLTERVPLGDLVGRHQAYEGYRLFGLDAPVAAPVPRLTLPESALAAARAQAGLAAGTVAVALLPGAARGPSKRWPAAHFIRAASAVAARRGDVRFLVCGTAAESAVCRDVAKALEPRAVDLAGQTDLPRLSALLALCRTVCCNDSGGMHLAAAVGIPVVAVFGLTDPGRTGPLGPGHRILTRADVAHDSAIARDSRAAAEVLASIAPEPVAAALLEVLGP